MIFLDTSAIYAWADIADPNHHDAVRRLQAILDRGEELLTHNYVLVESLALLQARLGGAAAMKLAKDSAAFVVEWVDEDLHALGINELEHSRKRHISLVDHISFLVMRRRKVATAFAFDPDFAAAGFRLFEAGPARAGAPHRAGASRKAPPKNARVVSTNRRAPRPNTGP